MMARLVLPAGAKADDSSWIERDGKPITWAQVAHENGVDIADDKWLADNAVVSGEGYGIHEDKRSDVGDPGAPLGPTTADLAARIDALTAKLQAKAVFTKREADDIAIVRAAEVDLAEEAVRNGQ